MDDLKEDAEKDFSTTRIADAIQCRYQQTDKHDLIGFTAVTKELLGFALEVRLLHETHPSNYFNKVWKEAYEKRRIHAATLVDFVRELWRDVLGQCEKFIKRYQTGAVQLSEVEETFGKYNKGQIKRELCTLHKGLFECRRVTESTTWVQEVVKTIQHCRELKQYADTASAVIELRDCLNLTGDFKEVQNISFGVCKCI